MSSPEEISDFTPFKHFDNILNNKFEPFAHKVRALIEIWQRVSELNPESDIRYMVQLTDWAKLHTLNIVLTAKWKGVKDDYESQLLSKVEKTQHELLKVSELMSKRCQKLADVIRNPWEDAILANLLQVENAPIGPKEIEFFCSETAYLVSFRLKKLCESQCEDLALNLVTAFMNCYHLSLTEKFNLNATKSQILFCFDVQVALLYRYNKTFEILALFKRLPLDEGLRLIRRFSKKRVRISKVWKHFPEITFLGSQVFITTAVTKPFGESGDILKELLEEWATFSKENNMLNKLEVSLRKIVLQATDSKHIYVCCEVIQQKMGASLKPFTIEMYVRALTTDMNNLESERAENDHTNIVSTSKRLANGFGNLAEILKDNIQVTRECTLTAFSLEPTLERLRKIEDLARASGFNVLDTGQIWECKLHPPVTEKDDLCWICKTCGKWMCKPSLDLRLTTNFALNEALDFQAIGIPSQLCDDLAVILNGPRYHLLSWLLRWEDLHRLCTMYLNDMEHTKNLVKELKFVDIDYSVFATIKREPVDELAGIERGYERFLYADLNDKLQIDDEEEGEEENDEDDDDDDDDETFEPPELPQAKSNPDTLKTLRMFRHNLKRNKPSQEVQNTESNNAGYLGTHIEESTSTGFTPRHEQNVCDFPFSNQDFTTYNPNRHKNGSFNGCSYQRRQNDFHNESFMNHSSTYDNKTPSSSTCRNLPIILNHQNLFSSYQRNIERIPNDNVNKFDKYSQESSIPKSNKIQSFVSYPPKNILNGELNSNTHCNSPNVNLNLFTQNHGFPIHNNPILNSNNLELKYIKPALPKEFSVESLNSMESKQQNLHRSNVTQLQPINLKRPSDTPLSLVPEKKPRNIDDVATEKLRCLLLSKNENSRVPDSSKSVQLRDGKHAKMPSVNVQNENSSQNANCIPSTKETPVVSPGRKINIISCTTIIPPISAAQKIKLKNPHVAVEKLDFSGMMTPRHPNIASVCPSNPISKLRSEEAVCATTNVTNSCGTKVTSSVSMDDIILLRDSSADECFSKLIVGQDDDADDASQSVTSDNLNKDAEQKATEFIAELGFIGKPEVPLDIKTATEHIPDVISIKKKSGIVDIKCDSGHNKTALEPLILLTDLKNGLKLDDQLKDSLNDQPNKISPKDNESQKTTKLDSYRPKYSDDDEDIFKFEAKPRPASDKELKIIVHRLSSEVIRRFIPSYIECDCHLLKSNGEQQPKCHICLADHEVSPPVTHVFERVDYLKATDSLTQDDNDSIPENKCLKTSIRKAKILGKNRKTKKNFSENKKIPVLNGIGSSMNPRVILERLDSSYVRSVLSNVPGLNDYDMIRPGNVNHIVNVVQLSGSRSSNNVPNVQNTQTSTQISPHIQRIGQPRSDKPEHNSNLDTPTTSAQTASTVATSKPATSQPSTLINILSQQIIRPAQTNCVRNRSSPLINILSQQIIRPATTQVTKSGTTNSNQISEQQTNSSAKVDQSTSDAGSKGTAVKNAVTNTQGQGTILQLICKSTLPKFQQAFGKSYQNNTETTDATTTCTDTNIDTKKTTVGAKTTPVNIQPIQTGVIYTRQMPVGQISLIPPGRGQVFRIAATSNSDLSLKDALAGKMNALLAAALQGKQKNSESQSDGESTVGEENTRVTVTRPTLVQNARIVKPVLQIPSNVIRTSPQSNLSSTTLEQLREFDMVYKQIKERSSTNTPSEQNPQADSNEPSPQRISVTYLNQGGQKYTQLSPVVVVSSYCNLQPAASPALSVTSQGSSSPCVTPAPTSSVPKVSSKGSKDETSKPLERVQSVLVTACTSNGPMLSHTPPRYRKPSEMTGTNNDAATKEEFLHNGEKQNNNEQKHFQGNTTTSYFQNKVRKPVQKLDKEMHQLCLQRKQAALERELRLQKSLSEECEDLGVDEPSTSDLFPEADILFDANHSPTFDQTSQELVKRPQHQVVVQEVKEENKGAAMTLFSDDDNSESLRTDFLFEPVEYHQPTGTELVNQQLTNGQSSASSGSSCEDNTLLQNCASMSDVTLNSPGGFQNEPTTPPPLNKYKFKYSNRRKGERHKPVTCETWTGEAEVSSSEDTVGSAEVETDAELAKSHESCENKHSYGRSTSCDEELSDGGAGYKVVAVTIASKGEIIQEDSCGEEHCEDDIDLDHSHSPSGRGARRSVKKTCSCCNGDQDGGVTRKRPTSRPHTPAPHKKAFMKKR